MNIMTEVCYGSTYLDAQHILDLANNSSWAWHTKDTMWTIWVISKSWAHLATLPFAKPNGFGRRPKDMLHTYDLIPILGHTAVQVGQVLHLPPP